MQSPDEFPHIEGDASFDPVHPVGGRVGEPDTETQPTQPDQDKDIAGV